MLRIWRAPVLLDEGQPLWVGSTQTLRWSRPIPAFGLWMPVADDGMAHAQVRTALAGFDNAEGTHPQGELRVLRLRTGRTKAAN